VSAVETKGAPACDGALLHRPHLDEEALYACMRCGFCINSCPTQNLLQVETASPRGRIGMMRAVHEGHLTLEEITPYLDACLGCRSCEDVCPAGVAYGHLLEEARAEITKFRPNPLPVRLAYQYVLGTPFGIQMASLGLWFYQATGLQKLAQGLGLVEKIGGKGLADMEKAVIPAPSPLKRATRKKVNPAKGEPKYKVAFFAGCVSEIVFWETNQNAVKVLTHLGCQVEFPSGQGCCGAVHAHAGELQMAKEQAKRNIAAFEAGGYDFIVNTAGGCGAALKEYHKLLKDEPEWQERAARFVKRCRDFTELVDWLIAREGAPQFGAIHATFTYKDSCHLRNVQKVVQPPRRLLKAIPGAKFVELPEADQCCGAAGTYAVTQAANADGILDRTMANVLKTGADTIVVANPPCHLEMIEGVQRAGLTEKLKVRHIADILAEAIEKQ
jgi:glycolate oxidase iron-sulfur subunit